MVKETVTCMRDEGVVGAAMICILDDSLLHTVTVPKRYITFTLYRGAMKLKTVKGLKLEGGEWILQEGNPLSWVYVRVLVQSKSDLNSINSTKTDEMRSSPTCSFDLARSGTFSASPTQQSIPVYVMLHQAVRQISCKVSPSFSSPGFFWFFIVFFPLFGGVLVSTKLLSHLHRLLAIYTSIYLVSLH